MTTLYLHIGHSKTGTTVQQSWLSAHRDWLAGHGLHYVLAADKPNHGGHRQFAKGFNNDLPPGIKPARAVAEDRAAVAAELVASDAEHILLSSENFLLADAEAVRDFLKQVRPDLNVRLIYFVRSQDELAESQFNQLIKVGVRGMEQYNFFEFVDRFSDYFEFYAHARRWEDAFGEGSLRVEVFNASGQGPVMDLARLLPLPEAAMADLPPVPASAGRENRSLNMQSFLALWMLNRAGIDDRKLVAKALKKKLGKDGPPALLFDSGWGEEFRARYVEDTRALTARYCGAARDDLGCRRYSDEERDRIRAQMKALLGF